jgi:hypothetical protein
MQTPALKEERVAEATERRDSNWRSLSTSIGIFGDRYGGPDADPPH